MPLVSLPLYIIRSFRPGKKTIEGRRPCPRPRAVGAHFPMSPVLVVAAHNVGYRWRAGPGPVIQNTPAGRLSLLGLGHRPADLH